LIRYCSLRFGYRDDIDNFPTLYTPNEATFIQGAAFLPEEADFVVFAAAYQSSNEQAGRRSERLSKYE